ncbi:aminotransferase class III-fold pyridoxal phosphate-dependent enzyme [Pendulispora albinea]|uniref:Aminotransferase class III-fold pyridoxal phosphate-dependent enzyme n=1 Tax=Pendulispora albinea TaxID=2741071 RepID=A0ABZ2MB47_9BACT
MKVENTRVGWAHLGREKLMEIARLDVEFVEARGDRLTWIDDTGARRSVLDLVGGFGSTLLGHNHPEVRGALEQHIASGRPTLVQASRRGPSERLRRKIAGMLLVQTGEPFEVLLYSTGTEAIEAGLKHARLEFALRQRDAADAISARTRELRGLVEAGEVTLGKSFWRDCERALRMAPIDDLDGLEAALALANAEALLHPGYLVGVEGGFHGKTMGALAVTWNPDARLPFARGPSLVRFLRPGVDALAELDDEFATTLVELKLPDPSAPSSSARLGSPRLERVRFPRMVAIVVEPIRGEGGVFELEEDAIQDIRQFRADNPHVPVLVDEIQTGLGRTGCMLEGVRRELPIDYLTLGKSLGGGIGKVTALAISRERYRPEYSLLHTSTFADDELTSALGERALEVIERDQLARKSAASGAALRRELEALQHRWPQFVSAVRGRGLMLGLELSIPADHPSSAIRLLSEEGLLTMILAGHLLHEHDVRVLPTVGRRTTLRFQPSAYFPEADAALVGGALEHVCDALHRADARALMRYLVEQGRPGPERLGEHFAAPAASMTPATAAVQVSSSSPSPRSRVAFLAHVIDAASLRSWDASLGRFSNEELASLVSRLRGVFEPRVLASRVVRSPLGPATELSLIGIFMTSADIESDLRQNQGREIRAQVHAAYERARDLGCTLVGFGGYTSIATGNCTEINDPRPAVTTGNALTVAMGHEAMLRAAGDLGIDVARAGAAVCGANGNIGQVHARLLAAECGSLALFGRPGSMRRLRAIAEEVAIELALRASRGETGGALFERFVRAYRKLGAPPVASSGAAPLAAQPLLARIDEAIEGGPLVALHEDLAKLREADLILTATNSATPIIFAEHLARVRPVVICDTAVPGDVAPDVAERRPNVLAILGGVVAVPQDSHFELPGFALPKGQTFACTAETILLGLTGAGKSYSRGALSTDQVREIMALATLHGFKLGSRKSERSY